MKYSVIVPVYNRPQEVDELLKSLTLQTFKDFELVIVEDGSKDRCDNIVASYSAQLRIQYFYKPNTGPGDSRNFGMTRAKGDYFIFFDSDCIIPPEYFSEVEKFLAQHPVDAFGGPDGAHPSFSTVQKAINHTMTSFITTGGIRGKKNNLDIYQPRSFNMGLTREVFEKVGGFSDLHPGEDPDLSYRIMNAGFRIRLIENAFVYHKRRIDFKKFAIQVYKFGVVRTILTRWHPGKFKIVYLFPSLFLLSAIVLLAASAIWAWMLLPLALLFVIVFAESMVKSGSLSISAGAVVAAMIQLSSYGLGFLVGASKLFLLRQNERQAFPEFFFNKKSKAAHPQ